MLKTTQLSARNTKMFDLNLSDSDTEPQIEPNESRIESSENHRLQGSEQHSAKQQVVSKSTKTSHYSEYLKEESKHQLQLAMQNSPVFNFRHLISQSNLISFNESSNIQLNKQEFDASVEIKKRFSGMEKNSSGKTRTFSGSSYQNVCNRKQKKKIQSLNDSVRVQDIEEIQIFHQTKTQPTSSYNKKPQEMEKKRYEDEYNPEDYGWDRLKKENSLRQGKELIKDQNECKNVKDCQEQEEKEQSQSEEESILQKPECIFNTAGIKFREVVYHDLDESQTQNEVSELDDSSTEQKLQGPQDQQIKKEYQYFTLFSQRFRSRQYIQMRNKLLKLFLSKDEFVESRSNEPSRYNENLRKLLTTAVPENHMLQFEVHVYKDLFRTEFQLWAKYDHQNEEETVLIAAGYNQSFNIDKTIYVIEQVNPFNQREFIAQLESNFSRNFYSLFGYSPNSKDHHSSDNSSQCKNTQIQQLLNISLNIYRMVYIPSLYMASESLDSFRQNGHEKQENLGVQKQRDNRTINLAEKYQKQKFSGSGQKNSVTKLSTCKSFEFGEDFYQQNGVRKSNKTLLIEESQTKSQVLFIGKIASKKYRLKLGQPISPLQALAITIAHVQSS